MGSLGHSSLGKARPPTQVYYIFFLLPDHEIAGTFFHRIVLRHGLTWKGRPQASAPQCQSIIGFESPQGSPPSGKTLILCIIYSIFVCLSLGGVVFAPLFLSILL